MKLVGQLRLQALVGQLGRVADPTRPHLSFEICQISTCFNPSTIIDITKAKKLLRKAKQEFFLNSVLN